MLSKWTIGAIASKNASASSPVSERDPFGERGGGQRAGGDDNARPFGGRGRDQLAAHCDQRLSRYRCGDRLRETVAIDRQRRAGGHPRGIGGGQDQRPQRAHLGVQQPDGVMLGIVRAEAVRADQLGELVGVVRVGAVNAAHLVKHDGNAGARQLPCGFAASKAAADDVDGIVHAKRCRTGRRRGPARHCTCAVQGACRGVHSASENGIAAGRAAVSGNRGNPWSRRMARLAFLGLGTMGYPMAGHLAAAGHHVTVYNRTAAKADEWVAEHGGQLATTPALAASGAEVVLACVGNDDDLRAVTLGPDGAFGAMTHGALFIDHTTVSAAIARELAGHGAARGIGVLDAPVSGGQAGAVGGQLTIMAGGAPEAFRRGEPVMAAYAKRIGHMGAAGCGQLTKMVNQIAIAGVLEGLAEALSFAAAAGLDADAVVDVIGQGAAQSWQMDNRAGTMARGEFDFGFAVDWMRKDLGLVLDEARRLGVTLPATALIDQFYGDVQTMGGGRQDTSSLIRRLR